MLQEGEVHTHVIAKSLGSHFVQTSEVTDAVKYDHLCIIYRICEYHCIYSYVY